MLIKSVAEIAETEPAFEKIERLELGFELYHPVAGLRRNPAKARFHAASKTVFASAPIDYERWIDEDWNNRVDAVTHTLVAAVGAISKSRLTERERATAFDVIRRGAERTKLSPPLQMTPLGSVHLLFSEGSQGPQISFTDQVVTMMPDVVKIQELPPEEISKYLSNSHSISKSSPSTFKLYKRENGRLDYREGWIADGQVVEHWGVCGEGGETRFRHPVEGADPRNLLNALSHEARAMGFKPIPISRYKGVVVERPVERFGSPEDLDLRQQLQTFLDQKLGWLGLGHCDGGSSGPGSMEAYCLVVDAALALKSLKRELASSRFSDFLVRLSPDGF